LAANHKIEKITLKQVLTARFNSSRKAAQGFLEPILPFLLASGGVAQVVRATVS